MTQAEFPQESKATGEFRRQVSSFRRQVRADGSTPYRADANRYHLYVSSACPWAHRAILVRKLKKLEDVIGMTIVDPIRDQRGWAFSGDADPVNGFRFLQEAYYKTDKDWDGRVTVPVLWDKMTGEIVNNESSEIMRMLNSEFDEFGDAQLNLYPASHAEKIDELNQWIYETVNNGVYRAGFATTQSAYEQAVIPLFESLKKLDQVLSQQRYLLADRITEADWRLFTTLVRFDPVYHCHFKCNWNRVVDFPNLWAYVRDLYQHPGVAETVDFDHIKRHYFITHRTINPTGIVPVGPKIEFEKPHGRG
ncbi:MAG: glutathione S-transferase family protein [Planctomycetes bacterium]|nr:glutathione S-transferase family protein [Planctomycetota bacterium]